jgi:hypothetical protein
MNRLHRLGWWLFLLGCVGFVAIGIRDGDWLVITASAAFLAGVVLLMLPER